MGKRNMEPASPYKQSVGLFLLAIGYLVIAFGVKDLQPGVKVSMMWLVSLYTIHTLGELCLSPIGLSMVNKLAPVKFASLLMGVWFLSTSAANKFAGTLSALYPEPVIAITLVEDLQTKNNVQLLPAEFDKSKAAIISDVPAIAMEKIQMANVKDVAAKEEIQKTLETSTLKNTKHFIGFEIDTLYDFFMLFVFMAGAASLVLFVLSKKLLTMMNGVR
jgi:POT family proton-dependent oligopeptide transporter